MGRSTSSWLARFSVVCAMAAAATLQSTPAMAAIPTAITGKVTNNSGGAGVPGVQVTAYRLSGGSWYQEGSDLTDSGGNYAIDELSAGTYRIGFSGAITTEYWNDKATLETATDITVVQGQTVSGKNAAVTLGGHITGVVSDASGPIKNAQVAALDAGGSFVADAFTNASGAYDLGVPSGNWRLRFDASDHVEEYYNDKATLEAADSFSVGSGSTVSGKNAVLASQSTISGTVTKPGGGALAGINVDLWRPDGFGGWWSAGWASTMASGAYTITGLDAGTYRICFSDDNESYISECYDNKATVNVATDVVVGTSASVSGKNAELAPAGHITGTITNSGGGPADACVNVYDATGAQVGANACADSSGSYDLGGLPSGNFRLRFESYEGDSPEYYNDKATLAAADPITVTAGSTVSGKNAILAAGARINGTVTRDGGGGPISGVQVSLLDSAGNPAPGINNTDYTGSDGAYEFAGLAPGTYRLRYDDNQEGVTEYFDNSPTLAGSTGVVVTAGQAVTKNASLAGNGHITGKVTRTGGFPLDNVSVVLYEFDGVQFNQVSGSSWTSEDGTYDLTPVDAGTYRLGFSRAGYVSEYYDNKPDLASSTSITVPAGGTISGKNAELATDSMDPTGGFIGGVVTKTGGSPVAGVEVCLMRSSNSFDESSCGYQNHKTGADGKYGFGDLEPGQYKVRFAKNDFQGDQFVTEYYNNKATASAADVLNITAANEVLTTVNAELAELSHVRGKVTKEDGVTPIGGVDVSLSGGSPNYNYYYATTAADGTYDLSGVEAGTYTLEFNDYSNQGYVSEFYDDSATESGATPVVVPANTVVSGKNARLTPGGHITGTIMAGGAPADGDCIEIEARDAQDNQAWEADESDGDVVDSSGKYDAHPLKSGSYTVHVEDTCGDYVGEWWDNSPTQSGATPISVTAPNTTAGKNFVLDAAGSIRGTVTKTAGGSPLAGIEVEAYDSAGELEESVTTETDGSYVIDGLVPDSYRVRFRDPDGDYATEFFTNKASLATADPISVSSGANLTGKNADLGASTPGHIKGKVTKQDGTTALPNIRVTAYGSDGDVEAGAVTDGSGNYDLSGLNGDDYRVKFLDLNGAYNTEWFDDAGNEDDATPVSLANGATVTGTNAKLASSTEIQNDVAPSISGVARVGSTLTADDGEWTPSSGLTLTRQWLADGTAIGGATGATFTPGNTEANKKITVKVTASKPGFTSATKTSAPTEPIAGGTSALTNSTLPTITGTAKVGQTLTASNGTWSATPDSYVYAWKSGGTAVGTNANTYVPVAGDVGKTITVTVTAKKAGFTDGTATSAATGTVAAADPAALTNTSKPTIDGTPKVGQTLTASNGTWSATPDSYAYIWKSGGTVVGANSTTYSPVAGDVGKTITVTVTAKKSGFTDASATSDPTTTVQAASATDLTNTSKPTISGTPKVGQTLTANEGTWSSTPDSFTYVWKSGGSVISGAASKTYVPVTGDVGKTITVMVTAKKAGFTDGSAVSDPTAAVAGDAVTSTEVYRFWSERFNNAHFFTASKTEADNLKAGDPNWKYEGVAFNASPASSSGTCESGLSPVYRFFSSTFASHFFTSTKSEADSLKAGDPNWHYEGVAYCAYLSPTQGATALYRFWSPVFGKHFFTASKTEADGLRNGDRNWTYEGPAYYVLP